MEEKLRKELSINWLLGAVFMVVKFLEILLAFLGGFYWLVDGYLVKGFGWFWDAIVCHFLGSPIFSPKNHENEDQIFKATSSPQKKGRKKSHLQQYSYSANSHKTYKLFVL
jgi:hypothetical protein